MILKTFTINGESVAPITLFGRNRHPEVLEWHQKVMLGHYQLPVNYLECPFPSVSHGQMMNIVLQRSLDAENVPDYYWWLDMDCIPLRQEAVTRAYQQTSDKLTVWGHAWGSMHKVGINGTVFHPYASQACLMFSRELYNALGNPDMDHHHSRSDTAEELTYAAKYAGYNVSLLYPSHSVVADTPLDNLGPRYGMGITYGPLSRPLWFHASSAPNPRHTEVFTETCKLVLANAFEGSTPHVPYG